MRRFLVALAVASIGVIAVVLISAWVTWQDQAIDRMGRALRSDLRESANDLRDRIGRAERTLLKLRSVIVDEASQAGPTSLPAFNGPVREVIQTPVAEFEKTMFVASSNDRPSLALERRAILVTDDILDSFGLAAVALVDSVWFYGRSGATVTFEVAGLRSTIDWLRQDEAASDDWVLGDGVSPGATSRPRWTKPRFDALSQEWVVTAVLPVEISGTWVGMLGIDLRIALFWQSLVDLDTHYRDFIVNDDDHEFVAVGGAVVGRGRRDLTDSVGKILAAVRTSRTSGFARVSFEDQAYLAAVAYIDGPGWNLVRLQAAEPGGVAATTPLAIFSVVALSGLVGVGYVAARRFIVGPSRVSAAPLVRIKNRLTMMHERLRHHDAGGGQEKQVSPSAALWDGRDSSSVERPGRDVMAFEALLKDIDEACNTLERTAESSAIEIEDLRASLDRVIQAMSTRQAHLAYLSHEVRTHLNVVGGFAELIRERGWEENGATYLQHIREAVDEVVRCVEFVLGETFAHIEATKEAFGSCSLRHLLVESLIQVNEHAMRHGVILEVEPQDDAQAFLCQRSSIAQILRLVAMAAIGRSMRGSRVQIDGQLTESALLLRCRDYAGYVPPIELGRMSDRETGGAFYSASMLDMHIALAREITQALGGTFDMSSLPDGLRVRISVPIKPASV